jgi:prevent-host-death family protein
MRSVNVAELKNQLSKYLAFAKAGEEIVIRDRSLPVAKLVPFYAEEASEEELLLVAAGKMRMPKEALNVEELLKIRTGKVSGNEAVRALLDDRAESL